MTEVRICGGMQSDLPYPLAAFRMITGSNLLSPSIHHFNCLENNVLRSNADGLVDWMGNGRTPNKLTLLPLRTKHSYFWLSILDGTVIHFGMSLCCLLSSLSSVEVTMTLNHNTNHDIFDFPFCCTQCRIEGDGVIIRTGSSPAFRRYPYHLLTTLPRSLVRK